MKALTILTTAALIATSGSALANQTADKAVQDQKPVPMTESQMDNVTGGALVTAILVDVVDVNNNDVQVAVPVNAAVAAGILGNAGAVAVQRPGRQTQ